MFHGICWIAIHFFVVVTFPLCALSSMGVNILGRYHSVRSILKFMLYFQNVLCGSWQRIYLLEFNSGTVKGVIFLDMNDPMTFQTDSDLIKYVLFLSDLLGSYAFKILVQADVTSMLLFGICIGRTKVSIIVGIDHGVKMWWNSREVWIEDYSPNTVCRIKEMVRVPKYSSVQVTSIIEGVVQDSISKDTCYILEREFGTHLGENLQCTPSQKYYECWKQRKGCQTFY